MKFASEKELLQEGAVRISPSSYITSDGRYWSHAGSCYESYGEPGEHWAEAWANVAIQEVMDQ